MPSTQPVRRPDRPRREHSTDFPAAERPRRGAGVRALNPDGSVPLEPLREERTGSRWADFGGRLWKALLPVLALACGATLLGPAAGAAWLAANDKPYAEYLSTMQGFTVNVVFGLVGLLVVQIARRQGITQRSQKTIASNQFATAASVEALAGEVAELRSDVASLRTAGAPAGEGAAGLDEEQLVALEEAGDRVMRSVDVLERLLDVASRTGPLRVVEVRRETPPRPGPLPAPAVVATTGPVPARLEERTVTDPIPAGEPVGEDVPLVPERQRPEPPPQRNLDEMLAGGMTWSEIVDQMDRDAEQARRSRSD